MVQYFQGCTKQKANLNEPKLFRRARYALRGKGYLFNATVVDYKLCAVDRHGVNSAHIRVRNYTLAQTTLF